MPTLNKPYENFEKPGLVVSYKLADVKVYKGALLGLNASGFAVPMDHGTASLKFIGVANETVDNSVGSAGDKSVNVTKSGSFVYLPNSFTAVQADLGKEVYSLNDNELRLSTSGLTNLYKVGRITSLETASNGASGVRIRIDGYTQ
jgi:hypothetical protein